MNHTYQTRRNRVDLIALRISTEIAKKSMYYKGATDFNSVPSDVKHISSLLFFKSRLVDYCIYLFLVVLFLLVFD